MGPGRSSEGGGSANGKVLPHMSNIAFVAKFTFVAFCNFSQLPDFCIWGAI